MSLKPAQSFDRSLLESQKRRAIAKGLFVFGRKVFLIDEEDDVFSVVSLGARVQDAVKLLPLADAVLMAQIFREYLRWDVLDVFASVVDDGLCDALRKLVEKPELIAIIAWGEPKTWNRGERRQVKDLRVACERPGRCSQCNGCSRWE